MATDLETKFDKWRRFLSLFEYGEGVPVFRRLRDAQWDIMEFRRSKNYQPPSYETHIVSVRLVCDSMAEEILAAATDEQDAATIAWVAAGLRCPSRPFCTDCAACMTVTSPQRPAEARRSPW